MPEAILRCMAVRPDVKTVIGVGTGNCANCSVAVYLSPSSQRLIKGGGVCVLCGDCTDARLEGTGSVAVGLAPGAIEEIVKYVMNPTGN